MIFEKQNIQTIFYQVLPDKQSTYLHTDRSNDQTNKNCTTKRTFTFNSTSIHNIYKLQKHTQHQNATRLFHHPSILEIATSHKPFN